MTKQADFKRRVRARMSRTGESYAVARAHLLRSQPDRPHERPPADLLHVTNGDSTVPGLRATGLPDEIIAWRDVLHEGPVPAVPDDELRRIRAAYLVGENAADIGTAEEFAERDRTLAAHREGRYMLWFEADLYDQLQVIQILARLAELEVAAERVTLVCVGEFPGIAHFGGLGELNPEQLGRLPAMAATLMTAAGLEHATKAWAALRAPEPTGLGAVARAPSAELRFVAEAFDRLSREYPSTRDGLSLTERRILAAVADGADGAGAAFVRTAERETRPFLGDTWSLGRMTGMAGAAVPLLDGEPPGRVDRHTRLRLTEAGRRVLDAQADHVELNGVDRWIGGVHLEGHEVPWRWDEGTESIR